MTSPPFQRVAARPIYSPVMMILGVFLVGLGALMIVPALVDLANGHPDWRAFGYASALTVIVGGLMYASQRVPTVEITLHQGFLLTSSTWFIMPVFAGLPLQLGSLDLSFTDAYFEMASGFTTTGSTVVTGLDALPPGVLLWRGMTQWVGGIGFVVVGVAVLPFLGVGGMTLFKLESSDKSEKPFARQRSVALGLLWVYFGLSAIVTVAYVLAGMTWLEGLVHMMSSLSTGGYSTSDGSMGHWQQPAVHWVGIAAMIAGSVPFVLYVRMLHGDVGALARDSQVRLFLALTAVISAALALPLWWNQDLALEPAIRHAVFNVTSIITTTGYASLDYQEWGEWAMTVFFFLTFVGACTGSTTGGLKIFRFEIFMISLRQFLRGLASPHLVAPMLYQNRRLDRDVATSVLLFMLLFLGSEVGFAVLLAATGLDLLTSVTGAATALANVGPGLGQIIGPAGNFQSLNDPAKWILSFAMIVGRLELFTVYALFTRWFWNSMR